MKNILGLDLGCSSIGWALVREAENSEEVSSIVKLGVRVNPLTADEILNFEKGKSVTTNAARTLKRSMRRNLQRYKLRRDALVEVLKGYGFITETTLRSEHGNGTTFETYRLRAKAAETEISLEEFARVLLMINKKRGYKSSRKVKGNEDGVVIDGMDVAKKLYEENLTPGELCLQMLDKGKMALPDFSQSCEQRFRQTFEREFDWLGFNTSLMWRRFGNHSRKSIAIDASYISKVGKKTPYIGKFWSGCGSAMKRGLEILGVGIVDIDAHD